METTFKLVYTIEERDSWRNKQGLKIKSNLVDDELIDCDIAESLITQLKEGSAMLEADKLLLGIAEAQKRAIETSYQELTDMALQAKVNADTAHKTLIAITLEAENKYEEMEKVFSATEQRFKKHIIETTKEIKQSIKQLADLKSSIIDINTYSLDKLTETLKQLIKLTETDPELVKLVLNHKNDVR